MIRSEILKEIAPILRDQFVVCNIGIPSQELHAIDDQPTNFYMLGTMGLASSIGLGLAFKVCGQPILTTFQSNFDDIEKFFVGGFLNPLGDSLAVCLSSG